MDSNQMYTIKAAEEATEGYNVGGDSPADSSLHLGIQRKSHGTHESCGKRVLTGRLQPQPHSFLQDLARRLQLFSGHFVTSSLPYAASNKHFLGQNVSHHSNHEFPM